MATIFELLEKENIETLSRLLAKNHSLLNSEDDDKRKPIHKVVSNGNLELLNLLILNKSPIFVQDESDWTPLHIAASKRRLDLVAALIENVDKDRMLEFINAKTENEQTALHYAASKDAPSVVQYLIDHGADLHIRDKYGQLAIHRAASIGSIPIVQLMLSKSANLVDLLDKEKNSPLYLAIENGHAELARYLYPVSTSQFVKNNDGKTSLELAEEMKMTMT